MQVIDKPVLAGDGAGSGQGLVLVEVGEDEAVGVGGHEGEIVVGVVDRRVEVEAQILRVQVGVQIVNELPVAGLRGGGKGLEVQREAAIVLVGGEELVRLGEEVGTGLIAGQEVGDAGKIIASDGIVIVDEREDFRVDAIGGDGLGDLVEPVDIVDAGTIDDGKGARVIDRVAGDRAVRREDVEPLRKEQVDLLDVLPERGVGGGVGIDIVGRSQAFAGVQSDVGRSDVGLAMGRQRRLLAGLEQGLGWRCERAIVARLRCQPELRQRLHAEQADDEDRQQHQAKGGGDIEDAAETLPALALRIVEDRFVHG